MFKNLLLSSFLLLTLISIIYPTKKENFPKFTLNMIRHSWAKRAIKSKVSASDCAISMGYSIKEFQDKYLISVKKLDNAAMQETN